MSQDKDPNQGEGDRISARRYGRRVREFIAEGKVPDAASDARRFVEEDPASAAKAEQAAKRGPHTSSIDELVAKGRTVSDRIRRALQRLRTRFERAK